MKSDRQRWTTALICTCGAALGICSALILPATAEGKNPVEQQSLREQLQAAKERGRAASRYLQEQQPTADTDEQPEVQLQRFADEIQPLLQQYCVDCHGPELTEGNIRIDTLNPDLLNGPDTSWWLEVFALLGKGEMPPPEEVDFPDEARSKIVSWLSGELQTASRLRREQGGHSSFRRMTRYEYRYALQDLLGLPFDFARDLPPEAATEDGFLNSSEMLHMSVSQLEVYRRLAHQALQRAAVSGKKPPELYWMASMSAAAAEGHASQQAELEKLRQELADNEQQLQTELQRKEQQFRNRPGGTFYSNRETGWNTPARWNYGGAKYAIAPTDQSPPPAGPGSEVAVIPAGQKLTVELGDRVADEGWMRVRVRAARTDSERPGAATLALNFGWQASNDSQAAVRVSLAEMVIQASTDNPEYREWLVPLSEIYPRNLFRGTAKLGELPNPSELLRLVNTSVGGHEIQVERVEVIAPVWPEWPPQSHRRIFAEATEGTEEQRAEAILTHWMPRAWRRPVTQPELNRKLELYGRMRPLCDSFEDTILEVLSVVLSAPEFLYLSTDVSADESTSVQLSGVELASRLAAFLWCSIPDELLLQAAVDGELQTTEQIAGQVQRMLNDERAERMAEQFVSQWLGMQLLEFLQVDRSVHGRFSDELRAAMRREPIHGFQLLLQQNGSVLDLLHADYVLANERLGQYYGLAEVHGPDFRRVSLPEGSDRGGLLVQAGLLAMNSDGKDSHPLKRGIWLLKNLLNDPPPPPPPAVPEIDLADPEIARLTLKQRIERHRDQAACRSCHARIDPWGIAFEEYDAIGQRRAEINGTPVDATSTLFNGEPLQGVDGLKLYLLENRQDQFVRALVDKLTAWGLGRPLTFADRAALEEITREVRQRGDGLQDLITVIACSELFRTQ